jgi:two-component system LytT family sensor kinase
MQPAPVQLVASVSTLSPPTSLQRPFSLLDVRPWLLVTGVAIGASLLFTAQIYFSWSTTGGNATWWQSMYWAFGDWLEWAILSPAIFWLSGKFRFSRADWGWSLSAHIVGAVAICIVHASLCTIAAVIQGLTVGPPVIFIDYLQAVTSKRLPFNLAVYSAVVCAWHVWTHSREVRAREAELAELRGQLAESQLFALRMQLNPHFLYNTLNAISSLMLKDVPAANLSRELDFIKGYLEIEQIRFGDRLRVVLETEPATLDAAVPNFILQPIVENAFRHAIDFRDRDGEIIVRTQRDQEMLVLILADNGPGEFSRNSSRLHTGCHVGLSNTRQRLRTLYGEQHQFDLSPNDAGGMTARIMLPFRVSSKS